MAEQTRSVRYPIDKAETVFISVKRQIDDGELAPHARLPSVRDLCAGHETNLHVIRQVLARLEKEGLIYRKSRSGCYVAASAGSVETATREFLPRNGLSQAALYEPKPVCEIRLFTPDGMPNMVAAWRRVLDDFQRAVPSVRVDLATGAQGHLQDLFPRGNFDVIVSAPGPLDQIGIQHLLPVEMYAGQCLPAEALSPSIADPTGELPRLPGIPLRLTTEVVLINRALAERSAVGFSGKTSWLTLRKKASLFEKRSSLMGMVYSGLDIEMAWSGLFAVDGSGNLILRLDAVEAWLREREKFRLRETSSGPGEAIDTAAAFLDGRLLFHPIGVWGLKSVAARADFPVDVVPAQSVPGAPFTNQFYCLAPNRFSANLPAVMDLIRHLYSADVQEYFNRECIGTSIRTDCPWTHRNRRWAAAVKASLALGALRYPVDYRATRLRFGIRLPGRRYDRGELTRAELLDIIADAWREYVREGATAAPAHDRSAVADDGLRRYRPKGGQT